jgi:hypothetical protein
MQIEQISAEKLKDQEDDILSFLYYIYRSDWGYNKEQAAKIIAGLGLDPNAPEFS